MAQEQQSSWAKFSHILQEPKKETPRSPIPPSGDPSDGITSQKIPKGASSSPTQATSMELSIAILRETQRELAALKKEMATLEKELATVKGGLEAAKIELLETKNQLETHEKALTAHEDVLATHTKGLDATKTQLEKHNSELTDNAKNIGMHYELLVEQEDNLHKHDDELIDHAEDLDTRKQTEDSINAELAALQKRLTQVGQVLTEAPMAEDRYETQSDVSGSEMDDSPGGDDDIRGRGSDGNFDRPPKRQKLGPVFDTSNNQLASTPPSPGSDEANATQTPQV